MPERAARGLSVHAACRLADLALSASGTAACVEHAAGGLLLERCALRCADHPLAHLGAPILSLARARANHTGGILSVVDTRCEGGAAAVRCAGGGVLVAVRVIYGARRASFWFTVLPGAAEAEAAEAAVPQQGVCGAKRPRAAAC